MTASHEEDVRLAKINHDIIGLRAELQAHAVKCAEDHADLKESIYEWLHGTPKEPGIMVRLDRVEQDGERRKVWTGAAIVAAITAGITTIWNLMTHGNSTP